MRTETTHGDSFHSFFLTGTVLLAGVDVSGLLEYVLRIALGAVVVGVSKTISDRLKRRKAKKEAATRLNRIRNRTSKKSSHGINE